MHTRQLANVCRMQSGSRQCHRVRPGQARPAAAMNDIHTQQAVLYSDVGHQVQTSLTVNARLHRRCSNTRSRSHQQWQWQPRVALGFGHLRNLVEVLGKKMLAMAISK